MAEIVVMSAWREQKGRRSSGRVAAQGSSTLGEVVLFTGVRYERFDDWINRGEHQPVRAEQK